MVVVLTTEMIVACITLLWLIVILKEERLIVTKHLLTACIRLIFIALILAWMISFISSIHLCNLAILIYNLWKTYMLAYYL